MVKPINSISHDSCPAWYHGSREAFVEASTSAIVNQLSGVASKEGWHIEREQYEEWNTSVGLLQGSFDPEQRHKLVVLHSALSRSESSPIRDVILEYNLRRRGLRIDAVLLAPGVILVIEFKRSQIAAGDRDQVLNYCINLLEFHERTRQACHNDGVVIIPIVVLTGSHSQPFDAPKEFLHKPWSSILNQPLTCGAADFPRAIQHALNMAASTSVILRESWLGSPFSPSSTIIDAAVSLFGQHQVSSIREHAVPIEKIQHCTAAIAAEIIWAKAQGRNHLILISGTPGAGKTLVGLQIAFDPLWQQHTVFVTGNAPLVDVLNEALKQSYTKQHKGKSLRVPSGYARTNAHNLIGNVDFKIVKAHHFLQQRGKNTASTDGSIVIFDEAQRTYEQGRRVLGEKLADHEANLIMAALEKSYPQSVIVALLGHNQAINRGERGAIAWLEAASKHDWSVAISDETLAIPELSHLAEWAAHPLRRPLADGHLAHSMRFYRNQGLESWAHALLNNAMSEARTLADKLHASGHTIWLTRNLAEAKQWIRSHRVGEERAGLIGSAQGRRLSAEGVFVEQKPDIAKWMIAPSGDIRSSNMLETTQNQYQIQGLEIDYALVCWDADLRRGREGDWTSYKINGAVWQRDSFLDVAKNGYRVLLTRARKGMVIFVPAGDVSSDDDTRNPLWYNGISEALVAAGARLL